MKFNLEQVVLFSFAILILCIAASSLLVSPLAWMQAAVHEIATVFERKPATVPVLMPSPSLREKSLTDELKLSESQPFLRYETVSPALLQKLSLPPSADAQLEQAFEKFKTSASGKSSRLANCLERLNAVQDLSPQEWTDLSQDMADDEGFLNDLTSLSETSANSINAMDFIGQKVGNSAVLQRGIQMLCLKGFQLMRDNQSGKALDVIASAAKLSRSSAIARLETQKAQTQAMDSAINSWARILEKQTDTNVLEESLHRMNALAASQQETLEQVKEPISRDLLSRLTEMSPGEIGNQIERIAPDYLLNKYALQKQKLLEKMTAANPNDPRIEAARKKFGEEISGLNLQVQQALERRKQGDSADAPVQSMDPQSAAEEVVQAKLDLLRIKTANLIASKNGNDIQGDIDRLVPRYFSFQPQDPFSKTNFRVDEASQLAYSVGPDLKDDKASILYDPTNGSLSAGDVLLTPARVPDRQTH